MNHRNVVMVILAAAGGSAIARAPLPDTSRLGPGFARYAGDVGQGVRALAWEIARGVNGVAAQVGPGAAIALVATLVLGITILAGRRLGIARLTSIPLASTSFGSILGSIAPRATRTGSTRRTRQRANLPARRAPLVPRVHQARKLAAAGRPALEVVREANLSRDAMALMARLSAASADPERIAGPGNTFRAPVLGSGRA